MARRKSRKRQRGERSTSAAGTAEASADAALSTAENSSGEGTESSAASAGTSAGASGETEAVRLGAVMNGPAKNEVDIDQAALAAEADAVQIPEAPSSAEAAQAAQVESEAAAVQSVAEFAAGAEPFVGGMLSALHGVVAPNWVIVPARQEALTKAAALALAYWFPHEIPPKYLALIMVAGALHGIAQDNKDPKTGAYKPLHVPPKKETDDAPAAD
jgi:hypothetical protein